MRVTGVVLLEPGHPELSGAVVHVRLLDVSRLDAPSVTLAETVIRGVNHRRGEQRSIPFQLEAAAVPPAAADLSIEAHVSVSPAAGTAVRAGDLVTTTANPVPASGASGMTIRVRTVGAG